MSIIISISTLRNVTLYNTSSVRSIIIWHLSTAKIKFNITSLLVLIALISVWLRTLTTPWPVSLAAVLIT